MAVFTLTFGAYADPSFVGMKAIITRSAPFIDGSGNVSQVVWTVTIAGDGTASLAGLPCNDDGTTYSAQWQALSYKPSPGNKTFQVHSTDGSPVDFDTLQNSTVTGVSIPGGVTPANLDGYVAALIANRSSQTYGAVIATPSYPNGA